MGGTVPGRAGSAEGRKYLKRVGWLARKRAICVAAGALLLALTASLPGQAASASRSGPAAASRADADAANVAVLDVVVLVDESGSESPAKVAAERQTAGTVVQTMLNPRSRVTVVGFGGVNHVAPDQNPVDVVCQPTIADRANLDYLSSCVSKLHRRTAAEGNDTDYAAALGQAMSYFRPDTPAGQQSPAGAIKVILMMTDGGVDVHRDTQQYGTDWRLGEREAVNAQLAAARQDHVQVWPLGFGTDITPGDASYLNRLAKGGGQQTCDQRKVSKPHYQVVNDPADAVNALDQMEADAGCSATSVAPPIHVSGGQSGTLQVTIPPIASNAAISVDRGSPGVQVNYYRPDGREWTDSSAISGQDSPVQVLHVGNLTSAEVGTWRIQLQAEPRLASQVVRATAFWQGAVRALITANPPSANRGQPINVTLSVLGPDGPIPASSAAGKLRVGITVSGDGLPRPVPIAVTSAAGPGDYQGTFTAPRRTGTLQFTGAAAGYGLYATDVPTSVQIGRAIRGFTATVQLPVLNSVQVGHSVEGTLHVVNRTGTTRRLHLKLIVSHALARISSPAVITASPGARLSVPFTVTFGKDSPTGAAWYEVKAIDAAHPRLLYNAQSMTLTVTTPPGIWGRYKWMIIGSAALIILIILAAFWARVARRKTADVRSLVAILRRNGEQMGEELRPPHGWSDVFQFIIRDEEEPTARLDKPQPGFAVYTVKRAGNGQLRLTTPAGDRCDVVVGGPGEHLEHNGLEVAFRDSRRRRSQSITKRGRLAGSGDRGTTPQHDGLDPVMTPFPEAAQPDEWL